MTDYRRQIDRELSQAENARAQGLEGRARVCARRAAGMAARAYLETRGEPIPTFNAVDLLQGLAERPELHAQARQAIGYLLLRVTPDFQLPVSVDLIAESRRLTALLLA